MSQLRSFLDERCSAHQSVAAETHAKVVLMTHSVCRHMASSLRFGQCGLVSPAASMSWAAPTA